MVFVFFKYCFFYSSILEEATTGYDCYSDTKFIIYCLIALHAASHHFLWFIIQHCHRFSRILRSVSVFRPRRIASDEEEKIIATGYNARQHAAKCVGQETKNHPAFISLRVALSHHMN